LASASPLMVSMSSSSSTFTLSGSIPGSSAVSSMASPLSRICMRGTRTTPRSPSAAPAGSMALNSVVPKKSRCMRSNSESSIESGSWYCRVARPRSPPSPDFSIVVDSRSS